METQQYVMAYKVEQDRLRAMLPEGFSSLRPVLRINAEVRGGTVGYVELNTAAEFGGSRGRLNVGHWDDAPFARRGRTTTFRTELLEISFTGVGIAGGCPAEKDNAGCYFIGEMPALRKPEVITASKEFCDCVFSWNAVAGGACGRSEGRTLPAYPEAVRVAYPRTQLTAENAAKLPCEQVLGAYTVTFER